MLRSFACWRVAVMLVAVVLGVCALPAGAAATRADAYRELAPGQGAGPGGVLDPAYRNALKGVVADAPQSVRQAAAQWLQRRLQAGFAEVEDYRQLGRLYGAVRDHAAQEQALWAGLNRYPGDEDLSLQLMTLYDPPDQSVTSFRRASDQYQRVVAKLLRDAPDSRLGRVVRGTYSLEFGYLPEAQTLFESVLADDPQDPDGVEGLATVYLRRQQRDLADGLIERALAAAGDNPAMLAVGERVYRSSGRAGRADVLAERRYRMMADPVERARTLCRFYAERERFIDAADALGAVLQDGQRWAEPGLMDLWASMWVLAGRADEGLAQLDALRRQYPENADRSVAARATLLVAMQRWDAAETALLDLVKRRKADASVMNQLAYQWVMRRKNLDQALELAEAALAKDPDNGYFLDTKGWALYALGRFEEASAELTAAMRELPSSPIVLMHLGDTRYRLGDRNGARRRWEQATARLNDVPIGQDQEMREARERLEHRLQAVRANLPVMVAPSAVEPSQDTALTDDD